ncbi:MAG: hypothetical protein WCD52_23010 [Xanthobacteraceae bacterium]
MFNSLRGSLLLIAIYGAICLAWSEFAYWIPPAIEVTYNHSTTPNLPVAYHDRWSMIAAVVPLAAILHLIIIISIGAIDRKKPEALLDRSNSLINVVLTLFSAAFLALTVLSGDRLDYTGYLQMWIDVLEGRDPWNYAHLFRLVGQLLNKFGIANRSLASRAISSALLLTSP